VLVEDLYAMIERVCHDNVFVHAETETMRRVELTETAARLTDLASRYNVSTYYTDCCTEC